ncbi:AbgT family transporter [Woodsholea maritima]|uniref:AbgT family transporter n=1 Tax=Woodsholea maritima TaxID=240237 RepID=UPI000375ADB3|nr:AbgT family transporter [Woodsholea maritima]
MANPPAPDMVQNKGILGWIERTGNRLPDPVFIFFYLMAGLIAISVLCAMFGLAVEHPTQLDDNGNPVIIKAVSLFSAENLNRLIVQMPATFTHFHPLGYVLVVMLGAGVAERTGLFSAAMRGSISKAPHFLLTPMVALVAMIGNHAADSAYVVLIPLAGVIFAAAGRHPIAGITAAFAGVSGGFSANIFPGQLDALLFGITETTVQALVPDWTVNLAGNWYFIAAMTLVFLPVIWFVTDAIVEPRLGKWSDHGAANSEDTDRQDLNAGERKGLMMAGLGLLMVIAIWALLSTDVLAMVTGGAASLWGGNIPLIDESATGPGRLTPFYRSLVAGFLLLFLVAGWLYGAAAGTVKSHRDVVEMMAGAMKDLGYYLVLAFAAAHFVALFNWSNLGIIFAVNGAHALEASGLPLPILMGLMVIFTGIANLFVGSASAKWALLAPVMVPMMMLLGVSPEMATATYRVGDSATNIITPLMVYFPLILVFAQRWQPEFGLGSLTAAMVPYSIWLMIVGVALTVAWVYLGWPLGPGAEVHYTLPAMNP